MGCTHELFLHFKDDIATDLNMDPDATEEQVYDAMFALPTYRADPDVVPPANNMLFECSQGSRACTMRGVRFVFRSLFTSVGELINTKL